MKACGGGAYTNGPAHRFAILAFFFLLFLTIIPSSRKVPQARDSATIMQQTTADSIRSEAPGTWKVFVDFQCKYSKILWKKLPEIEEKYGGNFTFSRHITSLVYHQQAFLAQCAAMLVGKEMGDYARGEYQNALFERQEEFMSATLGDAKKSEVAAVFADIAAGAGVLDDARNFTKEVFFEKLNDMDGVVKPAYEEHKVALRYEVYGTPKHVINERLITGTESVWGPEEWSEKLRSEGLLFH